MDTPKSWYGKNAGNDHQGLVIDETTGRNVAVAYDREDTALLSAAPDLLDALKSLTRVYEGATGQDVFTGRAKAAIAKAEGRG